eukprot:3686590-Amphidinium_carterae.1
MRFNDAVRLLEHSTEEAQRVICAAKEVVDEFQATRPAYLTPQHKLKRHTLTPGAKTPKSYKCFLSQQVLRLDTQVFRECESFERVECSVEYSYLRTATSEPTFYLLPLSS